ncbi:hypothetical protein LTR27_010260 [Elasticomyces elasticus]|nr:hypothetical protein LTR27_010260 [Elasticomyces elasticus]
MDDHEIEQKQPLERVGTNITIDEGHVREAMPTNHFNVLGAIAMNYSLISTPMTIGTYLTFMKGVGGSPVFVFGYILCAVFQCLVCANLAELASAVPHPMGQAHWVAVLAPKRYARGLSYATGALMAAGWLFWATGTFLLASQLTFSLVSLFHRSFAASVYQVYLLLVLAGLFGLLVNTIGFRTYTWLLRFVMVLINVTTIIIFVALLVRTSPKQSASSVFLQIVNETGWNLNGLVFLLGLLPGVTALNGFDATTHLTDEVPKPSVQIPQIMLGTAGLAAISGLPLVIVYMFCITDQAALLTPLGGQPILQLLKDSLNLEWLTTLIMVVVVLVNWIGGCGQITTSSRVIWSLAMRSAFPGSAALRTIRSSHALPINATVAATIMPFFVGLLVFASSTVLNAVLGAAAISFFGSYSIAIACALPRQAFIRQRQAYFSMGAFSYASVLSLAWMALLYVILCFPLYLPATVSNMNYAVAVVAVVGVVACLNWVFYAQKHFVETTASSPIDHSS